MNIALFGGTFDPIHRGHITVARAAATKFSLKQIRFVPADIPPHKQKAPITSFDHRYAMVVSGFGGRERFRAVVAGSPRSRLASGKRTPSYSIDTVRRVKKTLGKSDRLFFLIGMDAFQDIANWHKADELLAECDFIVAARPGFSLADVASSLPAKLRPQPAVTKLFRKQKIDGPLVLPGVTLHMLPETHEKISATQIRAAVNRGGALKRLVPDAVAEYIQKVRLYRSSASKRDMGSARCAGRPAL